MGFQHEQPNPLLDAKHRCSIQYTLEKYFKIFDLFLLFKSMKWFASYVYLYCILFSNIARYCSIAAICLRTLSGLFSSNLIDQSSCRILTIYAKARPILHDDWSIRLGENRLYQSSQTFDVYARYCSSMNELCFKYMDFSSIIFRHHFIIYMQPYSVWYLSVCIFSCFAICCI